MVGESLKPLGVVDLKALADAWTEQHPTWGQRRLFEEWNEAKLQKQGRKRLHPDRPHIGLAMSVRCQGSGARDRDFHALTKIVGDLHGLEVARVSRLRSSSAMTTAPDASELVLTTLRILRRPEIRTITGFCDEQIDKWRRATSSRAGSTPAHGRSAGSNMRFGSGFSTAWANVMMR